MIQVRGKLTLNGWCQWSSPRSHTQPGQWSVAVSKRMTVHVVQSEVHTQSWPVDRKSKYRTVGERVTVPPRCSSLYAYAVRMQTSATSWASGPSSPATDLSMRSGDQLAVAPQHTECRLERERRAHSLHCVRSPEPIPLNERANARPARRRSL